jgi:hypothetical protein
MNVSTRGAPNRGVAVAASIVRAYFFVDKGFANRAPLHRIKTRLTLGGKTGLSFDALSRFVHHSLAELESLDH